MTRDIDVLIIGAGINGAGLFRDLCEQGLACVIVDKGDFGSGTSAAPSRLIHGGLKYLETGEFGLVAQSTLERNLLLRNAPHLVTPLATVIPIFSWFTGIGAALRTLFGSTTAPRARGAVLIKIGLALYDFYGARHRVMPRHKLLSRKKALTAIPPMTPKIVAAGTYYDAKITHPERLVWELLADGIAASPASLALNHTTLTARDHDVLHFGDHAFRPRIVINAAGPWIDHVNSSLGAQTKMIGGTKGSHILLDHPELIAALNGQMIYFEADDGRICLVFDYLGRALVGSTDIRSDTPDDLTVTGAEIDYFLHALRGLLPGLAFDQAQIVYAYAGIRPLPASDGTAAGLISRDHSAPVIDATPDRPFPIIALVGGKWTTFRGFAEEVADTVLARLNRTRRISTQGLAIGGGRGYPTNLAARAEWIIATAQATGATTDRVEQMLARYGTTAAQVLAHPGDDARLPDAQTYSVAEIDWIITQEQPKHLADIVMRRTTLAITGGLSMADLRAIAGVAAQRLGWTADIVEQEIAATLTVLEQKHRIRLAAG